MRCCASFFLTATPRVPQRQAFDDITAQFIYFIDHVALSATRRVAFRRWVPALLPHA